MHEDNMQVAEKPKRKRRTAEEIAADRRNARRRQVRRERQRAVKNAKREQERREREARDEVIRREKAARQAAIDSERAAKGYAAEKAKEAERERARQLQVDFEDYSYGRDTDGAMRVKAALAMLAEQQATIAKDSDRLNLTKHTKPPSLKEQRRLEKEDRKAKGLRYETVHAEDGSRPTVDAKGPPLRRLEQQEINALKRVAEDYETAYGGGLRCRGFEPAVDGASAHGAHAAKLIVQDRLGALRRHIGDRDYDVLIAFVVHGVSPAEFSEKGAGHEKAISDELRRIIRKVVAFYNPGSEAQELLMKRDKLWKEASATIAAMERDLEKPPVARKVRAA